LSFELSRPVSLSIRDELVLEGYSIEHWDESGEAFTVAWALIIIIILTNTLKPCSRFYLFVTIIVLPRTTQDEDEVVQGDFGSETYGTRHPLFCSAIPAETTWSVGASRARAPPQPAESSSAPTSSTRRPKRSGCDEGDEEMADGGQVDSTAQVAPASAASAGGVEGGSVSSTGAFGEVFLYFLIILFRGFCFMHRLLRPFRFLFLFTYTYLFLFE
jgi:hypothetical protein